MVTVSDYIPGEPRSSTYAELPAEELTRLLDRGKLRNPDARFVGWYHSHLGHGVVPSKIDLGTQSVLQQFSPNIFALIVDPKSEDLEAYITEAFSPVVGQQAPKD
jgi:proteasome lid subunit RPN8/RPN11